MRSWARGSVKARYAILAYPWIQLYKIQILYKTGNLKIAVNTAFSVICVRIAFIPPCFVRFEDDSFLGACCTKLLFLHNFYFFFWGSTHCARNFKKYGIFILVKNGLCISFDKNKNSTFSKIPQLERTDDRFFQFGLFLPRGSTFIFSEIDRSSLLDQNKNFAFLKIRMLTTQQIWWAGFQLNPQIHHL